MCSALARGRTRGRPGLAKEPASGTCEPTYILPQGWSTFRQPLLLPFVKDLHRLPFPLDLHAFMWRSPDCRLSSKTPKRKVGGNKLALFTTTPRARQV